MVLITTKQQREQNLNIFHRKLINLTKLNYAGIRSSMVGTEEPILYVFSDLILNKNIRNIYELGCGNSTIWFTYLCLQRSAKFVAFENEEKWKNECSRIILKYLGIKNPNIQLVPLNTSKQQMLTESFKKTERLNLPFEKADLIFSDGLNRLGTILNNLNTLHKNTILIADDEADEKGGYSQKLVEIGKFLDCKEIKFFWSRDRIISMLDKNNLLDTGDLLYWTTKIDN